ncbi:MAG: VWA domain-containing protein [Legionella sp.]|nr:VWA domain-containing protein [Legionella sp.]
MTKRLFIFYAILFFNFFMVLCVNATSAQELPEIHLLVDTSGSMKQTDPQNLRVVAVRLFDYLVSERAVMSVSTFANDLKQVIPPQTVTSKFQEFFLKNRKKITSDGEWTNIDAALIGANKSWTKKKKVIILITDGMLDLGSEVLNKKSTQHLNETTIPALQKDQVQVYTIGLSHQADMELLSNIALKTNALFQPVISAKDLDNALYAIFSSVISAQEAPLATKQTQDKKAVSPDSINTSANTTDKDATSTILVDKSIHQVTLIFKKNEDTHQSAILLSSPAGKTQDLNASSGNAVSIGHYKMINIDKPAPGNWILKGPSQELKQVLILTNVNLITNFSSGVYFNDELLSLTSHLEEDNKLIASDILLDTMQMSFELEGKTKQFSYVIPYKNKAFQLSLLLQVPNGNYVAKLTAKSGFLSRARQFTMSVQSSPFQYHFNSDYSLKVELIKPDLIDEGAVKITTTYQNKELNIPISKNNNTWDMNLSSLCQEPSFSLKDVFIRINASLRSGRSTAFNVPIDADFCPPAPKQLVSQLPPINLKPVEALNVKKAVAPPKPEESNFKFSLIFLAFILLFILIISISFVMMRINHRKKIEKIREQTL